MFSLQTTWEIDKPKITTSAKGEICITGMLRDPLYEAPMNYEYFPQKHLLYIRKPHPWCAGHSCVESYYVDHNGKKDFILFPIKEGFRMRIKNVDRFEEI